jgi:cytochrome b561
MTTTLSSAAPAAPTAGRSRYSAVAIVLHWTIAALILTNIALAWYFNTLKGPDAVAPIQLHKSIGITVLLFSLVRLSWRLISPPPLLPPTVKGWERVAAQATHVVFYVLMLGLPLTGWAFVSASPLIKVHPTVLYGLIPWPAVPYPGLDSDAVHAAHKALGFTHETLAKVAYAAIVLHVSAALKHQFLDRDDVVARMIPLLRRGG